MSSTSTQRRVFLFGDPSRLRPYLEHPESLAPLNLLNIWRLRPTDIIVSPRPRSTFLESLFFLYAPKRRPALITASDGYIFRQNADKKVNKRYGRLNQHVLGDRLIVMQPKDSIKEICQDLEAVTSMIDYDIIETTTDLEAPSFVLIAGNDPFFDLAPPRCIDAFQTAYHEIRNRFGDTAPIYLSAADKSLHDPVLAACPGLRGIGRFSDAGLSPNGCVFIGSPSTVLHDQFLAGAPTFLLPLYRESGFEAICTDVSVLLQSETDGSVTKIRHKTPANTKRGAKLELADLVKLSAHKRPSMFSAKRFFTEFQPIVLMNELRLLALALREKRQ